MRGTDGVIYTKSWNGEGTSWTSYSNSALGTNVVPFAGNPVVVSMNANNLVLFARGVDGLLYWNEWNGSAWSGYLALGTEKFTNNPAATTVGSDRIDVFVRGTDGKLYWKSRDPSWASVYSAVGTEQIVGSPVAVPGASTFQIGPTPSVAVFVRGTDRALYTKTKENTAPWPASYSALGGSIF